jgi:hypothetical protein
VWGQICQSAVVAKGLVGGSGAMLALLMGGGRHSEYGHWPTPRMGVRRHGESCVPGTDDGDAFGCRILPWKRLSFGSLSSLCSALFLSVMPWPSSQAMVASMASRPSLEASIWNPVPVNL